MAPFSPSNSLGLGLFFYLSLFTSPTTSQHVHNRRAIEEHVTLSDCRDSSGVFSSQAAYFPTEPGPVPQDVAVVTTTAGQTALWINTKTEALFTGTNTKFTATLGPKVNDGEYAGMGDNGYTTFNCWQKYKPNLYTYGNTTCSQVYDCNHDPAPSILPTPSGAQPSDTGTSPPSSEANSGLAQGSLIGIIVGAVGGVLFLIAAVAVFWYWRKTRKDNKKQTDAERPTEISGDGFSSPPPPFTTVVDDKDKVVEKMTETRYEADGRWYRVEMGCDHGRVEMDAEGITRSELPGDTITDLVVSPLTDSPTLSKTSPDTPKDKKAEVVVEQEKEKEDKK
ncbi:hypothetical protein QBC38DRAFT_479902 [Podospora fimiseda]|uniref:Mid2 domain-containing protein n=1 Tax=Podospora fimiseda TaxID=252190 RepID=A0AAN7BNH9_9PEZI|nr:hypothetical protein QBC38DRAFT_479902 [Podospora fimiseda]